MMTPSEPRYAFVDEEGVPLLVVTGQARGGNLWIAQITGLDSKFKLARRFIGERHERVNDGNQFTECGVRLSELESGWILELCSGGKWRWQHRACYLYETPPPTLKLLDDKEVKHRLRIPTQQRRFRL